MTGRATFGDFLHAAQADLAAAGQRGSAARGDVGEVSRSLLRLITVMGRYTQDITTAFTDMPAHRHLPRGAWNQASVQAREALTNSAAHLLRSGNGGRPWPATPSASPLARHLDDAASSLAAGRDLLSTHFTPWAYGGRSHRSEWALAIRSEAATRATLTELGALARRAAHLGANAALSPQARKTMDPARRRLNAACQWLWILSSSVQAAHRQEPTRTADRDLLAAIPLNELPARRALTGRETVRELCDGVISTAERLRHFTWQAGEQPPWSPALTVTSMRQIAESGVVASHNCELLARTLADRTSGMTPAASAELATAGEAAQRSTGAWHQIARDLRDVTTDTRGHVSPAAAEARALALWTGRLAYADPTWTISSGPGHPTRSPEGLAARPEDLRAAVAAVHHAGEALAMLTQAEHHQLDAASQARRILVPTRTLSSDHDVPRPYAPAPRERDGALISRYHEASQTTREAADGFGRTAQATSAPSRVLVTARQATQDSRGGTASADPRQDADHACHEPSPRGDPGPMEHTLIGLGVTSPRLLARGVDIDRASKRLLLDVADEFPSVQRSTAANVLSRDANRAELVNHALASADPRASALLRRRAHGEYEAPEPEPGC